MRMSDEERREGYIIIVYSHAKAYLTYEKALELAFELEQAGYKTIMKKVE